MSRENFDADMRDIVAAYVIGVSKGNLSHAANDLGVSRQTIRRIAQGDTQNISQKTKDAIAENFSEQEGWKKAKANFGADVVKDKVTIEGNRKEAFNQMKKEKSEFNKEVSKAAKQWKDLTADQKTARGRSPDGGTSP